MRAARRCEGTSLTEVIVSLAILGVAMSQVFIVFGDQQKAYRATERGVEAQQDVRLVADAILNDLRMAGYMVQKDSGIASFDGGATAADMLCVSDPEKIADTTATAAVQRLQGAGISSQLNANASSVTVSSSDVDIDGDGDDDFVVEDGVIIVDGTSSHCARITGVSGVSNNVLAFKPNTPAGFTASVGSTRVVPAVIYRLNGTDLMRNGLRVASRIEDLQVEFAIDANGDGLVASAEYQNSLNGNDPDDLLEARLSVIARTDEQEDAAVGTTGRPANANRTAGAPDSYRRRTITTSIMPRNLM